MPDLSKENLSSLPSPYKSRRESQQLSRLPGHQKSKGAIQK